jgi:beta-glucosidase-like glycosyl hydrolase
MNKEKSEAFSKRTKENREKVIEEVLYRSLATLLRENVNYYDVHYIVQRVVQIIEEARKNVDFKNEEITKLRRKLAEEKLKEIKANIKTLPEKKENKDETDIRNEECEQSAQAIVGYLLEHDLVFSDADYFNDATENDDELLLYLMVKGYIDVLYDKLLMTLAEHERRAFKNLWGCEKEKITMEMLDSALKLDKPKVEKKKK